jgi:gentisate 1,2-dioxygenase
MEQNPMTEVTPSELAHSSSLEALCHGLGQIQMVAGWNRPAPGKSFRPHRWSYVQAKAALDAAGRLINTGLAERRNLVLVNPTAGNIYATARTMMTAYQMLLPGERARTHRHTPNALRLVLDAGPGAYTIVDGKKLPMLPGDVLLTPNWAWHGHVNEGHDRAYWLDFLDVPLVEFLDMRLFEQHTNEFESEVTLSEKSAFRFSWSDTERKLNQATVDASGPRGIEVELGNTALESISLFMMRLVPGITAAPYKRWENNIYAVVRGNGVTELDGKKLEWQRGDVVVIPARHEHTHRAVDDAVLFRVTDAPVMTPFRRVFDDR